MVSVQMTSAAHMAAPSSEMSPVSIPDRFHDRDISRAKAMLSDSSFFSGRRACCS